MKKLNSENNKPKNIINLQTEIAYLKNKILELENTNRSLIEIISILPGHVYWKDTNGILIGCNNAQAKAAGLKSRVEIAGLRPIDLIKKEQPEKERIKQAQLIEKIDQQVIQNQKPLSAEETAILDDGSTGYFLSNKTPMYDEKGKVKGLVGVTLDITQVKQLEKNNKSKSRFIINISTMIRDTLSSVLGTAELLTQTTLSKKQSRCTEVILNSINKTIPILDKLYDYVDLVDDNLPVEHSTFNLKDFLHNLVQDKKNKATKKGIQISLNYDPELSTWVEGARYFLSHVINIIIDNAIKHTEKGNITITAKNQDNPTEKEFFLLLEIKDSGKGMSEQTINELFNLFDGDNQQEELFVKSGLDLSIAVKMLHLINATISVKSKISRGTSFAIKMPLRKAMPKQNITMDITKTYDDANNIINQTSKTTLLNILVLDSDPIWQKTLKLMLEDAYNCNIQQALNLDEIANNLEQDYDLIIMDVGSPDGDFLKFAKKLKSKMKNIPIIVITACSSDDQREVINETNITDIIAKPVGYHSLIDIIDYYVFQSDTKPSKLG